MIEAAAAHCSVSAESCRQRCSTAPGRDRAAYLAHGRATATPRQPPEPIGLPQHTHVSNLIRRTQKALAVSPKLGKAAIAIDHLLGNNGNSAPSKERRRLTGKRSRGAVLSPQEAALFAGYICGTSRTSPPTAHRAAAGCGPRALGATERNSCQAFWRQCADRLSIASTRLGNSGGSDFTL